MHQHRGHFNIVGEARRVSGAVVTHPASRRVTLELDDALVEGDPFELSSHPVVHGELIDGSPVSLLGCTQTHWGAATAVDRSAVAIYACQFWVLGAYVEESETFSRIDFGLTDLVGWVGQKGFHLHYDLSGEEPVYSAQTAPHFVASATTNRGAVFFHAGPSLTAGHRSADFGTKSSIEILPDAVVTLANVLARYVRPLQDLLTIATGRPQEVLDLRLVPSRSVEPGESPRDTHDWAEVRFARWSDEAPQGDSPFPDQMLFSLSDLSPSLSESLEAWFVLDDEVHEFRTLATGPTYRGGMFVDQRLLYAVHAIETYHRRRIGGRERGKSEHKALIKQITEAVLPDHRKWLKEKLAFSNELSLLRRLREVRSRVCPKLETLLKAADHWEEWTRDTRNFNTHFTRSRRKSRIAERTQLLALTESILLVMDDLMLAELGISELARNILVERTRRYERVSQWFAECDWSAH